MKITDTPRTNEAITVIFDRDGFLSEHNAPESLVVLCRKLERENASLTHSRNNLLRIVDEIAAEVNRDQNMETLVGAVRRACGSNIASQPTTPE